MKKRASTPNRLRMLRAGHRLTQFDMGERLSISQTRYWQIENNRCEPTDRERKALARLFSVPESEIFPDASEAIAS